MVLLVDVGGWPVHSSGQFKTTSPTSSRNKGFIKGGFEPLCVSKSLARPKLQLCGTRQCCKSFVPRRTVPQRAQVALADWGRIARPTIRTFSGECCYESG